MHHLIADTREQIVAALAHPSIAGGAVTSVDTGPVVDAVVSAALAHDDEVVALVKISSDGRPEVAVAVDPLPQASDLTLVTVSVTRVSGAHVETNVHAVMVRTTSPVA